MRIDRRRVAQIALVTLALTVNIFGQQAPVGDPLCSRRSKMAIRL